MKHDASGGEDFASLLAEFEGKSPKKGHQRELAVGDTVRGRIISIGRDAAFVEVVGGKAEGMLELDYLRNEDGNVSLKVGDELEARVVEVGGKAGCAVLRQTTGRGIEGKAELAQAFQLGLPVEGTVASVNKGGVDVTVSGVRAFCPISQLDARHVEDPGSFIGQKLRFRITKYETDKRGVNMVVSRRALLEEEGRARAAETRAKLAVGAIIPGVVTSLKDYGAFVDLGGLEGMLHASEIAYGRTRPADVLSLGQRLEVQILKIEKTDDPKRPERISLSLKSMAKDPWEDAVTRYPVGTKITKQVRGVEPFGAFVELEPGMDGLVPLSELAQGKQARTARDLVKPGDTLEVTVISVDPERRRISLGIGDRPDALDEEDYAAARRQSSSGFGTLGDLLRKKL
jgi:small subunit ribosomal protein S1